MFLCCCFPTRQHGAVVGTGGDGAVEKEELGGEHFQHQRDAPSFIHCPGITTAGAHNPATPAVCPTTRTRAAMDRRLSDGRWDWATLERAPTLGPICRPASIANACTPGCPPPILFWIAFSSPIAFLPKSSLHTRSVCHTHIHTHSPARRCLDASPDPQLCYQLPVLARGQRPPTPTLPVSVKSVGVASHVLSVLGLRCDLIELPGASTVPPILKCILAVHRVIPFRVEPHSQIPPTHPIPAQTPSPQIACKRRAGIGQHHAMQVHAQRHAYPCIC